MFKYSLAILKLNDSRWLTNDIAAVICNEGFAVNIDELCDKRLRELGMCSQATECDVLRPLVLNLGGMDSQHWQDI